MRTRSVYFIITLFLLVSPDAVNAKRQRYNLYVASGTLGVDGALYTIDVRTGALLTTVGPLDDGDGNNYGMTGLAYQPANGILYGATVNSSPTDPNYLVTVDPATALVTPIGPFGAILTDLAVDPTTGIMYAVSGFNQKFYSVNQATGEATQIGSTLLGFQSGGGLAADKQGALYGVDSFSFYSYNKTNGNATLVGLTLLPDLVRAADFDSHNVFYGLEGGGGIDNSHLRFLITINLSSGLGSLIGPITVNDLDAIAFVPATR